MAFKHSEIISALQ